MLVIINAIGINLGGGKVILQSIINAIKKKNIKQIVLLIDQKSTLRKNDYELVSFDGNYLKKYFDLTKYVLKKEKESKCLIISLNSLPILFVKSKQWIMFQNRNLILSCLPKIIMKDFLKAFAYNILTKIVSKKNIVIVYHLDETLKFLKGMFRNSTFIKASVVNDIILKTNKNKLNIKTQNNLISGRYIIITSNAINKNNNVVYNAWSLVNKKLPKVTLSVIGLKEKPKKLREFKNIKFFDNISNLRTHNELKKSNILVFTSVSECLGLPLLEAKAHGLKIIAPDFDFVWEVVQPDFVYNHRDYLSLSRAMITSLGGHIYEKPNLMNAKIFLDLIEKTEKVIFK